jgi:tRNA(fMet)-specific endonuclease VapC
LILADTDVLIDYLAGVHPVADQVVQFVRSDRLQMTAVSCFELLSGAREGKRGEAIRRFAATIPVVSLDRGAAEIAAGVRQELMKSGNTIGMADSLIAGIALSNALPLFTRNRKHFDKVDGLELIVPD